MWSKGTLCTDAEAETPVLWPPDVKNWLIEKDPHAGKDWRQEEKGTTENEMVGSITDLMDMSLSRLWELVVNREARRAAVHGVTKGQTRLSDWTVSNRSGIRSLIYVLDYSRVGNQELETHTLSFCYFLVFVKTGWMGKHNNHIFLVKNKDK